MAANGELPSANGQHNELASPDPSYTFPEDKLRKELKDSSRTPLVLVACGSFSPITYLHLRMFEMASDYIKRSTRFELIGAYLSPVSDAYEKNGLALANHRQVHRKFIAIFLRLTCYRIEMCDMAADTAPLLMVDPWEAIIPEYTRTATVLDHFDHEINDVRGGILTADGSKKRAQIALLAGADLIETFISPGIWSDEDLSHILVRYGAFVVERSGTDLDQALAQVRQTKDNIYIIRQLVKNDVSSTKVRDFISKDMSINYLIPPDVIKYINKNDLYRGRHDIAQPVQA